MMKKLCKVALLTSLLATATQYYLLAQSPVTDPTSACENSHRIIAPKNPRMSADRSILSGQSIVQTRLALSQNTILQVIEYPATGKDIELWNSTIILQRGQEKTKYPLGQLIRYGAALRLVEIASLCANAGQNTIVLAFESYATGADEGFVIIRYSPESVEVKGFPPVRQGRIVIDRSNPNRAELWSATGSPDGAIECDACEKIYQIQDCRVGEKSTDCVRRPGTVGPLPPGKFMGARIDVR
jgi:hypothetical protein